MDINGYYPVSNSGNLLNPSEYFEIATSIAPPFASINGRNNSTAAGATGILGIAGGATGATYAVRGENSSITGNAAGVMGNAGVVTFASAFGAGPAGVRGQNAFNGVVGFAQDRAVVGVLLDSGGTYLAEGQLGKSGSSAAIHYGVTGFTAGTANGNSGVKGADGSEPPGCSDGSHRADGVRGCSMGDIGVTAIAGSTGFSGLRAMKKDAGGATVAEAYLAYLSPTAFGLYANVGTIGCNGCVKQFVDPHPTDAAKTIHYVSLEGPEAGTYFRGTARTQHGEAVIVVPEHFQFVTDEEGLTVQLTAVGAPASMYVESQDLNQIVVRSSRDVTFHYLVQGIRPAHKNFQPIVDGREYVPAEEGGKMPEGWTEWAKQRLIQNGTYNPDGTVNMKTAERLGWTKLWAPREKPTEVSKSASPQQ
jgi:hypothetical protein